MVADPAYVGNSATERQPNGHGMYTVTLPNGRTYTYGPRRRMAAIALANKTGGTFASTATAARCDCGRDGCYGCDDAMDAARDADIVANGIGNRRYRR